MQPRKKTNSKMKKQPIPEDFELSDDEPTTIKLDEDQKLTSKNIVFECPLCNGKLQLRNEIEISPKGLGFLAILAHLKSAEMIRQ